MISPCHVSIVCETWCVTGRSKSRWSADWYCCPHGGNKWDKVMDKRSIEVTPGQSCFKLFLLQIEVYITNVLTWRIAISLTVWYKTKFGSQNFGYQIWFCTRLFNCHWHWPDTAGIRSVLWMLMVWVGAAQSLDKCKFCHTLIVWVYGGFL